MEPKTGQEFETPSHQPWKGISLIWSEMKISVYMVANSAPMRQEFSLNWLEYI